MWADWSLRLSRVVVNGRKAHEVNFAASIDCDSCRRLVTAEFLADAFLVAHRRQIPIDDVLSFALWWFHDALHPVGNWHPTGVVDMPVIHEM